MERQVLTLGSRVLVLAVIAVLCMAAAAECFPGAHRPRRSRCALAVAPVDAALTPLDTPRPLVPFRMRMTATAQKDCPDTTLTIDVPAGAAVTSGSASWRGAMARGETRQVDVTVRVPSRALFRFYGVVEVRQGNGVLMRQAPCEVGSNGTALSAPQVPAVVTAPDGTRMMVLPAREVAP